MIQKKISSYISIRMGIAMSAVMSIVGSSMGAVRGTNQALSHMPPEAPKPPFMALFMSNFAPALGVSIIITVTLAILIGFIVPMKKVNDGIESKTKLTGFGLHLVQSLVSDLIYTPFISLVMAFVSTLLFVIPKSQAPVPLVPAALGSFVSSCIVEFIIALVVIMIIEPIIQKAAFKKYIPNFGQGVEGDENI